MRSSPDPGDAARSDLLRRVDRLESELAIRQLPARYAQAVDSRDLPALAELFVAEVENGIENGASGHGRDELRTWFAGVLSAFYRSVHFVTGHTVQFQDADHATGTAYCRAEHEDGDRWIVMAIVYRDTYRRDGGVWYFVKRKVQTWYIADMLERPQAGASFARWPGRTEQQLIDLPAAFPSWAAFWGQAGDGVQSLRTRQP